MLFMEVLVRRKYKKTVKRCMTSLFTYASAEEVAGNISGQDDGNVHARFTHPAI